jgi:hypothetical protein
MKNSSSFGAKTVLVTERNWCDWWGTCWANQCLEMWRMLNFCYDNGFLYLVLITDMVVRLYGTGCSEQLVVTQLIEEGPAFMEPHGPSLYSWKPIFDIKLSHLNQLAPFYPVLCIYLQDCPVSANIFRPVSSFEVILRKICHVFLVSRSSYHLYWFDYSNNIRWRSQIIRFSLCHFL